MYERFYGLNADPFRLSPDHRFCFNHDNFAKAKAYIDYALHRAEGFVMITGRPGTGKTTLVHDLLERLTQQDVKVATLMSTRLGAEDLLRMTAYAFGVDAKAPNKAMVLQGLLNFLVQQYQYGKRALLIIDESQDLSIEALEELRLLTNLQQAGQPLLQIVLIGQESLRDLVRSKELEQLHQRLLAAWHLEPLSPQELIGYIQHRLIKAGWQGDPQFKPGVMQAIYQFSGGVPRMINLVTSRLLLHGFIEELHTLTPADIQFVLGELQQEDLIPHAPMSERPDETPPSAAALASAAATAKADWARIDCGLVAAPPLAPVTPPAAPPVPPSPQTAAPSKTSPPPSLSQILQHEDAANLESEMTAALAWQTPVPPPVSPAPARNWRLPVVMALILVLLGGGAFYAREFIAWRPLVEQVLAWLPSMMPAAPPQPESPPPPARIVSPPIPAPPPVVPQFTNQPGLLTTAPVTTPTAVVPTVGAELPARVAASQAAFDSMTTSLTPPPPRPVAPARLAVSFARNSVVVDTQFDSALKAFSAQLQEVPTARAEVIGYSDRYGNPAYNLTLSQRRAEAVAAYLVTLGVARDRLRVEGRGPREATDMDAAPVEGRVVELTVIADR
ncbi:hypothetical protein CKO12_00205 [Chromatium okenii]|uniref:AAA family ATPase n=1 Tax=Chromatium okenii TaxID=61644 RepID=UPI001908D83C|nr:AAA family ATPase [Chromatium okenii]MBK1640328.1 hypothetical protein [Chromatium okenii]